METFVVPKELVENPHYKKERLKIRADFSDDLIDVPLIDIITRMNKLPYCFTIQSCYGYFLYPGREKIDNLKPLPETTTIDRVV